jgi:hypothetical protein
VVGIFKQKNPGNAIVLLVYSLILKFPIFLYPVSPVASEGDNYIYKGILQFFSPLTTTAPVLFSIFAFLLLFTQATLLNRICNSIKLFPKPNYLVAMSYILVTSLMREWSYFSAPLIVNTIMIWVWYRMIALYNSNTPKTSVYNVAVLIGVLPLLYSPSIAFVLLLMLALLITRPLRITEWMVALLGLVTPYYFLVGYLYLTDQWALSKVLPTISFYLPQLPSSLWITGGIIFLVLPFLFGGFYVQDNLNKMLIHVRKSWSLLLVFLMSSLLIIVILRGQNYLHWMLIAVPICTFHAAAYYYIPKRSFALILHWVIFIYCIVLNYYSFNLSN